MHDVVVVGIPLIAILAGILFSRSDIKELSGEFRNEIKELRNEMRDVFRAVRNEMREHQSETRKQLSQIDADMRQFYHLTGSLDARVDAVEKR